MTAVKDWETRLDIRCYPVLQGRKKISWSRPRRKYLVENIRRKWAGWLQPQCKTRGGLHCHKINATKIICFG